MKQTKKQSLIEATCNTVSGFIISVIAAYYFVPIFFNVEKSFDKSTGLTIVFTVISILRNYGIRRVFNWKNYRRKGNKLKRYLIKEENDIYDIYYSLWSGRNECHVRELFYEDRGK